MKKDELYRKAIEMWGIDFQEKMLIEECAEVIQAWAKLKRKNNGATFDKFMEELADLEIMMEQIKQYHLDCAISQMTFENMKRSKLKYLAELLDTTYEI